jgi:hypothetical protein
MQIKLYKMANKIIVFAREMPLVPEKKTEINFHKSQRKILHSTTKQ